MTERRALPERRALDLLLALYPDFDLLEIDWQVSVPLDNPWLLVTLGQRSDDGTGEWDGREAWARHRFAIWKRTGAIHGLQHDGSVTDDPLYELD